MKKSAFTLAEVLITLTIIGVIAALTIPNLMQKWQDHADVVKVKTAYSILSNAYKLAVKDNGEVNDWTTATDNYTRSCQVMAIISQYLKFQKKTTSNTNPIFVYNNNYFETLKGGLNSSNGPIHNTAPGQLLLDNGMFIAFYGNSSVFVDINGRKGKTKLGYDVFNFAVNNTGLRPTHTLNNNTNGCSIINSQTGFNDGLTCSDWVLKHGNMDYKYRDISAEW